MPRVSQVHTPMLMPGFGNDIDISARQELRKKLQCKSMDWYPPKLLQHILSHTPC